VNSKNTELEYLTEIIRNFCQERDWDSFHGLKDLAIGMVTEASELLELTRFQSDQDIQNLLQDPQYREKLSDELADVFFFLLRISDRNNFDLHQSLINKMKKNALKYPVAKAKGNNKKYDEL
jgi:NTP pyrophosphatase (non-canonical NTP hydrolase)